MSKNRFSARVTVAAGFLLLCAAPGLTRAQGSPPRPPQTHKASPAARPKNDAQPTDDFAGLKYTDDQKEKIDQIHQDMKSRMDITVKDEKLTAEQRDAMLAGYQRMERSQIFKVLTTQQRKEVLRRIRARHLVEQEQQKKVPPPK